MNGTARDRAIEIVADLTDEHRGWYIRVHGPSTGDRPGDLLHRDLEIVEIRRYTRPDGVNVVALTDRNDGSLPSVFIGTERAWPATARCELLRQVHKPRRRKAGVRRG